MKTPYRTTLLAALTIAVTGFAHAADVTGKWQSEFESPIGQFKYIYDLKADGGNLTGKASRDLNGEKSEIELKEGKISGEDISFVEMARRDDQEFRIEYKGKLAGDEIKFTRKVGDFATMEIAAKREKSDADKATQAAESVTTKKPALKVIKVDSQETSGEDGRGDNAVDGNPATIWHTQWQDDSPAQPHEIIIELSAPARIKGFTCLPRQNEDDGAPNMNGTIKDYEFFVSAAAEDFGPPVKKGTFDDSRGKKTVTFEAKQGRFIKLRALSEINGQPWTSVAELEVIQD